MVIYLWDFFFIFSIEMKNKKSDIARILLMLRRCKVILIKLAKQTGNYMEAHIEFPIFNKIFVCQHAMSALVH